MRRAVLVNGVPASGKSTLARALGRQLHVPVLELAARWVQEHLSATAPR